VGGFVPHRVRPGFARALALGLLAIACGPQEAAPPAAPAPAAAPVPAAPPAAGDAASAARKEAQLIFSTRCFPCHGATGAGNGTASAGLVPQPRNFMDPDWQKSVTDAHIEQIILYGGAAVGRSPTMPGNPDLHSKPAVVTALREYVRSLAR
jgi:mono/diheme cytochrome c family protein